MSAPADVASERRLLVETLRAVGPDLPTLVAGWSSLDVARHLAAQDRLGGVPAFAARRFVVATGVRSTDVYLDRPRVGRLVDGRRRSWAWCLGRLSHDPPRPVVASSVAAITLWEHVVHHEDVRRAGDVARPSWPELAAVVDWLLRYQARRLAGAALELRADDGRTWTAGAGDAGVVVEGGIGDLVLWLSGRPWADVDVTGDGTLVDRLAV